MEVGLPDLHPEIHKLLGRLQFRSSYGQNALKLSMEVAWLSHHMAAELGANAEVAKRAGRDARHNAIGRGGGQADP
jgi:ribonuclease Y